MPQQLRVVRCYQCKKFQSDIVKKAPKWVCKLCGSKQSLIKEFARGSGKECRLLVQQLSNREMSEEQIMQEVSQKVLSGEISLASVEFANPVQERSENIVQHCSTNLGALKQNNKWESFCEPPDREMKEDLVSPVTACLSTKPANNESSVFKDSEQVNSRSTKFNYTPTSYTMKRPATSTCLPLMDFHQVTGKFEKEFKYHSKNASTFKSERTISSVDANKTSDLQATFMTEAESSSDRNIGKTNPLMNYSKKSKREPSTLTQENTCEVLESTKVNAQSPSSSSKWSQFLINDVTSVEEEL
ncbi:MRN complex-interacting protein [Wyeomyia smithii]|uniref:MRN complex-interacting protein n=1 Tax=Wyeomyia smithii TaxID=174621 RepID=UPI002467F458|nr:MRN complex-interacting protein [Wyeomyia smithii]